MEEAAHTCHNPTSLSITYLAVNRHHGVAKQSIMMSTLTAKGKGKVVPVNTMKAQRWGRGTAT
jgi:hypothetical protein